MKGGKEEKEGGREGEDKKNRKEIDKKQKK